MVRYLTIDGGTTNTRICLVEDGRVTDTLRLSVGARLAAGNGELLKNGVRDGIRTLLERNALAEGDIRQVIASGMITCEYGLCHLPHISAPAGLRELHDSAAAVSLPEISPIPFTFIRGVKLAGERAETTDMMRGEETELIGLGRREGAMYVLPGSHSKLIATDEAGRITDFTTMLTGEMLAALSSGTILKDAVSLEGTQLDEAYLLRGCRCCRERGLNEALFKVRILKNLYGANRDQTYSFFLGAVLWGEIGSIPAKHPKSLVIGGKKQLQQAMAVLLRALTDIPVTQVSAREAEEAPALGAVRIFEGE